MKNGSPAPAVLYPSRRGSPALALVVNALSYAGIR